MATTVNNVFPAHAGMNRQKCCLKNTVIGVPRTRGDEPFGDRFERIAVLCSPHTRG